ncbi:hypothetical protein ACFV5G_37875 [Streptomyces sp. NPDC059766]|uniref:hypothetical protein n=1 Tax=Streptomyces sp. NPDC059766 TaxID=3346940 RepID=UPI0036549610
MYPEPARRDPPQSLAPHIPADVYRRAEAAGSPVVIVVQTTDATTGRPLREYLVPLAVAGAGAIGVFATVAAFLALLDFAVHTATAIAAATGPISVGGITLKLARPKR